MLILIVDDNVEAADSLANMVRLWDFDTEVAYSGLAAFEMAVTTKPDAVVADLGMPGSVDGFELARRISAQPELKGTLLIAISGQHFDDEGQQRAMDAGMAEFIAKPADLGRLHRLLEARRG